VLGFLYGAGDAPSLDRNRIFARWLQKKVGIDGAEATQKTKSLGPDRQLLPLTAAVATTISFRDETGALIAASDRVELKPGRAYRLELSQTQSTPSAAGREATPR
jgi:hypothetical protein